MDIKRDLRLVDDLATRLASHGIDRNRDVVVHCQTHHRSGAVSEAGPIRQGQLLQAKDRTYSLAQLLADDALAANLDDGVFATIYLAPHNYHRVHAPCGCRLVRSVAIPGRLFSVNAVTAAHVPGLFARNERLVLTLEGSGGAFALVLVGAMLVASIRAAWPKGPQCPYREQVARAWEDVRFERGDEVATFLLGSTVVLLFPPGAVDLLPHVAAGRNVRVGERIGTATPPASAG